MLDGVWLSNGSKKCDGECKVNNYLQVAFVLFVLFVVIDIMDQFSLFEAPFPLDFSDTKILWVSLPSKQFLGHFLSTTSLNGHFSRLPLWSPPPLLLKRCPASLIHIHDPIYHTPNVVPKLQPHVSFEHQTYVLN